MSNLPIQLDTLEKCVTLLKEELSEPTRKNVNLVRVKVLEALKGPKGSVLLITGKTPLTVQAVSAFLFHVCNKEKTTGQKIIFLSATEILEKNLKVKDAQFLVISGIELVKRFDSKTQLDIKSLLSKVEEFKKYGGTCVIPTYFTFGEMEKEFGTSIANYLYKSTIAEFQL